MSTTITVTVTSSDHGDAAERLARIAAHVKDDAQVLSFRDGEPHPVISGFNDDTDDGYLGVTLGTLAITDAGE